MIVEWVDEYKARFIDVKKVKKDIDEFLKDYDEKKNLVRLIQTDQEYKMAKIQKY